MPLGVNKGRGTKKSVQNFYTPGRFSLCDDTPQKSGLVSSAYFDILTKDHTTSDFQLEEMFPILGFN